MMFRFQSFLAAFVCMSCGQLSVWAANPVSWEVEISTTGQDVTWTSPTNITTGLPEYDWEYDINEVLATVFNTETEEEFELDLITLLEVTSGSGTENGLPFTLLNQSLSEPTTGSNADISIVVNSAGQGIGSGTNIVLGQFAIGDEIYQIKQVAITALVSATGVPMGDYDRDGDVDPADYAVWRSNFGSTVELNADGNKNSVVDAADYVVWRNNLGVDTTPSAGQTMNVPEPSTISAIILALLSLLCGIRRPRWCD